MTAKDHLGYALGTFSLATALSYTALRLTTHLTRDEALGPAVAIGFIALALYAIAAVVLTEKQPMTTDEYDVKANNDPQALSLEQIQELRAQEEARMAELRAEREAKVTEAREFLGPELCSVADVLIAYNRILQAEDCYAADHLLVSLQERLLDSLDLAIDYELVDDGAEDMTEDVGQQSRD